MPDEIPIEKSEFVYELAAGYGSPQVFAACSSGLYRSDDGGLNWRSALDTLALTEPIPVVSVALSPTFTIDRTVVAGLPGGALRSTDGGDTWQALSFQPPPPNLTALAFSPNYLADGVILGGTAEDGFLRSSNGGESWSAWNFGLLDLEVLCLTLSLEFLTDEMIFAGTGTGVFRSTNGGRAWREVTLPGGGTAVLSLACSAPTGMAQVYLAGTEERGLFRSFDQGKTWDPLGTAPYHGPVNAILMSNDGLYLAALVNQDLIFSRDAGQSWTQVDAPDRSGISAVLAPDGLAPDLPLLLGLADGRIVRLESLEPHLQR